jgi:hypothetical protein
MAKHSKQAKTGRTAGPSRDEPRREEETGGSRLENRSRVELYEMAKELGVAGRDDMSRAELVEAIRRR